MANRIKKNTTIIWYAGSQDKSGCDGIKVDEMDGIIDVEIGSTISVQFLDNCDISYDEYIVFKKQLHIGMVHRQMNIYITDQP